jgi:hypothetical protein
VVLKQDTGGRRRPGEKGAKVEPNAPAAQAPAAPAPQQQAQATSAQRLDALFGKALCGYCHEVVPPAQSARKKWEVLPVRVAEVVDAEVGFDHAAHTTSACAVPQGRASSTAADVLMPPIETCRKCHGGEAAIGGGAVHLHDVPRLPPDALRPMFARPVQARPPGDDACCRDTLRRRHPRSFGGC